MEYYYDARTHERKKNRSCLSLVQLCTLLNYNTEDQITTHSPSAYTQGSMKIKYQCSKSIKGQDSCLIPKACSTVPL